MSDENFLTLKDDIEVNGQREPVVVFDDMVLDGWHRYQACVQLCLEPKQKPFDSADDPVAFVKSQNLHRRHLTVSERAAAVVACSKWHPPHRAKKMAAASTFLNEGAKRKSAATADLCKTDAQMANEAGVSLRIICDAKAAHKAGLLEAVRDGAMTATEAASVARGTPAKAATAAARPAPWDKPADDDPTAAELAASEREAAEELDALRRVALADDKVATALDEAKKLRALNRVLQERNNGLMAEKDELVKRIKALQRKLDKLEQPA